MISSPEELRQRTKQFALRIIKLFRALPKTQEARVLGKQVLRSGTAVAANYRSACRARSRADFISKIGITVEEADETAFWLELLIDANIVRKAKLENLLAEANELVRIFAATRATARSRLAITDHKLEITNT
jgi:four helix bundle protein